MQSSNQSIPNFGHCVSRCVDRIERPFNAPIKIRFWFAVTLFIAILLVFPYAWTLGKNCSAKDAKLQNIYVIFNVLRDFLAVTVMMYFNYQTARSLRNNGDVYSNVSKTVSQKTKKISRTLLVMVTVFTICVVPVDMFQFVVLNLMKRRAAYINTVNTSLVVLQMSNSIANVIIYSTDANFRLGFLKMMKQLVFGSKSSNNCKKNSTPCKDINDSLYMPSSMSFQI